MRIIPTKVHAVLDYLIGAALIAAPWLFDFARDGASTYVPVILGIGIIIYSLVTDYEFGVARLISVPTHLGIDIVGGLFLAVSPWLFGFSEWVFWPHVIVGIADVVIALMTKTVPERRPHTVTGATERNPTVRA